MPSATHQHLTLLFLDDPALAFELAQQAGAPIVPRFEGIAEITPELDDPLLPGNTLRADAAFVGVLAGVPRQGLAFEIQLGRDSTKEWSLAFYWSAVRWRLRCPAWVVVVSPSPDVRAWLRDQLFTEEPELQPLIVTPEMLPAVGLAAARAQPTRAVLTAVMRAGDADAVDHALIALQALLEVMPTNSERYAQLVAASVGKDVMNEIHNRLPPPQREQLSEWERRGASFLRGLEEGLEEGRQEGRQEGQQQGLRAALHTLLEARGFELDATTNARIDACTQPDQLRDLIAAAATITSLTELRW